MFVFNIYISSKQEEEEQAKKQALKMMISLVKKKLTSLFAINCRAIFFISLCLTITIFGAKLIKVEAKQQQQQQFYSLQHQADQNQIDQLLAAAAAQQSSSGSDHNHNIPGHYEFEVAPKMEPPTVRKPPYQQSAQMCPGSG